MWFGNVLLFFLTLSFYRFWGRTRIRQYVWNHISIFGDRLEYTGTGKELCIGFLITLPIYGMMVLVSETFESQLMLLAFLIVGYFAVFSGYRYRITRTNWRAIRSHFPLSMSDKYSILCLKRAAINGLTLGLTLPRSDLLKWQFLVENFSVGNVRARFNNVSPEGLGTPNVVSALLGGIAMSIVSTFYIGINDAMIQEHALSHPEEKRNLVIGVAAIGFAIGFPFYYLIRQWYTGALVRRKFNGIQIGSVTTVCRFTVRRYMGFKAMNLLILIGTLGLGSAFILHRKAKFFCRYIAFDGAPDDTMIQQMQSNEKNTFAEGFMDAFGIDLAFLS